MWQNQCLTEMHGKSFPRKCQFCFLMGAVTCCPVVCAKVMGLLSLSGSDLTNDVMAKSTNQCPECLTSWPVTCHLDGPEKQDSVTFLLARRDAVVELACSITVAAKWWACQCVVFLKAHSLLDSETELCCTWYAVRRFPSFITFILKP